MPIEVESTSQVEELTRVLKKRVWWILVPFAVIATLGTSFAVLVPKKYVAKTRILVREVRNRSGQVVAGSEGQGRAAKVLIRSPNRIRSVVRALGWPYETLTRVEQEILVEKIMDNLVVDVPPMGPGTAEQVVEIKYGDTNPDRAHDLTEEMSRRWREETLEATRKAKQRAFNNLDERNRAVEMRVQEIADDIAELMERHGIPPWKPDYYQKERPAAPEFQQLVDARKELSALEEEVEIMTTSLQRKEQRYERMGDVVPYVEATEGVSLDKEIRTRREKIVEYQNQVEEQGYKPTHSKYKEIYGRIQVIEAEIAMLEDSGVESSVSESWRENVDKVKLGVQIEDQRVDLDRKQQKLEDLAIEIENLGTVTAELQGVYQELAGLENERARLNANLQDFGEDLQDMRIELDLANTPAGDPFVILDPVTHPSRPTEPNPTIIATFSILMGLAVGLGLAMLLEFSKSCFRNVNDVTRVMVVPVLGVVGAIVTTHQRRRSRFARRILASGTLGFVLLVGYVTWAWANRPDLLSDGLRSSIEGFRSGFE